MIPFGELKNNMEILKKYLVKMQFFSKIGQKITVKQIEETNLRRVSNEIFLPLINFILVQYSPQLFMKILQISPNIKYIEDKLFIEQVFIIARKILNLNFTLTIDQFLTSKYFEKKVEFIANLSQKVYEWNFLNKKNKDSFNMGNLTNINSVQNVRLDSDEEQQEAPRSISTKPIKLQSNYQFKDKVETVPIIKKQFKLFHKNEDNSDSEQESRSRNLYQNKKDKKIPSKPTEKPLVLKKQLNQKQLKNILKQSQFRRPQSEQDEEEEIYQKYLLDSSSKKIPARPNKITVGQASEQSEEQNTNYVTKDEMKELLQFMKEISVTINQMSQKFEKFQKHVTSDLQNTQAKVLMLEGNINMIKDNL